MPNSIRSMYPLTLLEGQGMGTAYEYRSKLRVLHATFARVGAPRNLLAMGLPEKHGYDLDFVLLAHELDCPLWVCEDRPQVLAGLRRTLEELPEPALREQVQARPLATLLDCPDLEGRRFDWLLSTASVQRLADEGIVRYLQNARSLARYAFLFIPNSGNRAHLTLSGLRGMDLAQILALCDQAGADLGRSSEEKSPRVLAAGYCDIPPFPPGLQRSTEAKEKALHSPVEALAMQGLEWWCLGEAWMPRFLQKRLAHLIYVALDLREVAT